MKPFAAVLFVLATGCATDSSTPDSDPRQLLPKTEHPTFSLYMSNQSLDTTLLEIHVSIDGQPAVAGDFDVFTNHGSGEGCGGAPVPQHNWYQFDFDLTPGPHDITVASDDVSATLSTNVTVGATKYGILDYWFDATSQPERFDFVASTEQPLFE